jgi:hypothetical protein
MKRRLLIGLPGVWMGLLLLLAPAAQAQFAKKWLSAGSLHNWYSAVGSECEVCGFTGEQQDGMRWPGLYRLTDMQAAKSLWIAATNVTDQNGTSYPYRVVHVGPRVSGSGEFFPTRFEMVSRFDPPTVFVDGELSEPEAAMANDLVDPTLPADRVIVNEVNTLLGLSMQRRILQFSQDFHDNYHVIEYTFTNTGNTDDDAEIELPNQTLEGVYFFYQWRWSVAFETRYVLGNPTSWGKNAMLDTRGDGVKVDPPDENFRAQYVWHGRFPPFTAYDNLGGPIMPPAAPAINVASTDTLGRLGASQFVGMVTLHADRSAAEPVDDPAQPTTTSWIHSDDPYTSQNDAFNPAKMEEEYAVITTGHKAPRHADAVEPTGLPGFLQPTADPSFGTPGGYSNANGYGPYTLAPGQSIRIVIAEGAAGLSREENVRVGRLFKEGQLSALEKNTIVFQGQDSLFQTFRRALANYQSGYQIPKAPLPPSNLEVSSGGDRISLVWDTYPDASLPDRWEVWRARGRFDSTYVLVHTAAPDETTFDDLTPIRGIDYYYYVVAVDEGSGNDGTGLTPPGRELRSSRYYTQTYSPARLKRPQGRGLDEVRVVPNPFNIGASQDVRFSDQTDKLAFFNIPGFCQIEIFTELGELVDVIEHQDGSGDAFWDHTTSSRQIVASGLYIAVITVTQDIEDTQTGEVLFRQGERTFRKFVIIR